MNILPSQHETDTQRLNGILAIFKNLGGVLYWLTSLTQLTREEQEKAGIYLCNQRQ